MQSLFGKRPSASMVVAVAALAISASGTAVAASLVNGDGLIAKRSLSGNRLRSHTITGTEVNLRKLGKVPSAKNADRATTAISANTAGSATTATNATNAGNAGTVGGQPPSAFDPSANFARTGIVGTNEGQSVTLATFGPFTLTLTCVKIGGNPDAQIFATSNHANSEAGGQFLPTAGVQSSGTIVDSGSSGAFTESVAQVIDFAEPGNAWMGDLNAAVNYAGDVHQCVAWGVIDKS